MFATIKDDIIDPRRKFLRCCKIKVEIILFEYLITYGPIKWLFTGIQSHYILASVNKTGGLRLRIT